MGNSEDEDSFNCNKSMSEDYEKKLESVHFYHILQSYKKSVRYTI